MKFKIDNDLMIDDFFHDARLLGIVAPIDDYKFCWHVNQLLKFKFRINTGLEIQLIKKDRNYFFSIYDLLILFFVLYPLLLNSFVRDC